MGTLLLSLGPILIVAGQGYHCAAQAVTDAIRGDLGRVAGSSAEQLGDWLMEKHRDLDFLSSSACLRPECDADGCMCRGIEEPLRKACRLLAEFSESFPEFRGFAVYDTGQSLSGGTGTLTAGLPQAARRTAVANVAPEARLVLAAKRPPATTADFLLGVALTGPEGTDAGAVYAELDFASAVRRILDPERLGPSTRGYVINSEGDLIARASQQADAAVPALPDHVLSEDSGGPGTEFWAAADGIDVVGGFARIPRTELTVVIERERGVALAWLGILAMRASLVVLGTAIVVLLFSRWTARRLTHPLELLAGVARRTQRGETDARVPGLRGKEVQAVGSALNEMLDALEVTRERLARSAALAAVGELSSSIVHELRNPLSSVKMNLQALRRRVADDAPHAELAQIASEQVARIERMLDDLLHFARPMTIAVEETTLDRLMHRARPSLEALARERSVRLRIDVSDAECSLKTDPESFCQILENLVRNAVEASETSVSVVASVRRQQRKVVVDVIDDGPGIPAGSRDRLFQPFFSTKKGGTGLGLASVRKIVQLLGGTVEAANLPEGGARFRVSLPAASA